MRIRKWLTHLFPKRVFFCPKCKNPIEQNTQQCPYCGEKFPLNFAVKCPRKLLQREHEKELSAYVHQKIFPSLSETHRNYLARYFTTFFTNGFEEGDLSAWDSTGGTPEASTTSPYTGTYCLKLDGDYDRVFKTITSSDVMYAQARVKWTSNPDSGQNFSLFFIEHSNWNMVVGANIYNDSGTIKWRLAYLDSGFTEQYVTVSSPNPTTNTWYLVELYFDKTTGTGKLYVDGVELASTTSVITYYQATEILLINVKSGGTSPTIYYDDIVVADAYIGTYDFNDGFESNDFSKWSTANGSIQSTTKYSGTYAAQFTQWQAAVRTGTAGNEKYVQARVYLSSMSGTDASSEILMLSQSAGTSVSVIVKDVSGTKHFYLRDDWGSEYDSGITASTDQWYLIELSYKKNTSGWFKLWIDGTLEVEQTGDTSGHMTTADTIIGGYNLDSLTITRIIDDVKVSDSYIGTDTPNPITFITQVSNVDSVADIGSHSNFANQQADDSTYDTLTEANTVTQGSLTYRTAQNAQGTSLTSPYDVTVNKPTGIVEGDIIFVAVAWYTTSGYTIDGVPSGFTSLGSYTSNSDKYALYYKIAGASEPSSYTFSFSNTVKYKITSFGYSGGSFNPSDPIDVVSNTAYRTSGTTVRAASMTVANANSPLIFIGMQYNTSSQTFTKPSVPTSDWVENYDSGSTTPDFWFEFCSMIWSGSGATGNMDATSTGSNGTKHAFAVALKPIPPNYRLELEEEFTDIPYSSYTTWTLHVKTGSYSSPAETLNIQIRDGSTWTTLGALTASTDNTFNVTSYIVASTEQIRFIDGTTSDDVTQSTWQIDAVWLEGSNITVSIPVIMHHLKQMGIS
jgi:hypothetical protein